VLAMRADARIRHDNVVVPSVCDVDDAARAACLMPPLFLCLLHLPVVEGGHGPEAEKAELREGAEARRRGGEARRRR